MRSVRDRQTRAVVASHIRSLRGVVTQMRSSLHGNDSRQCPSSGVMLRMGAWSTRFQGSQYGSLRLTGRRQAADALISVVTDRCARTSRAAAWSFMPAARARGLGTCWTTLHLVYERETAASLGIPYERIAQVGLYRSLTPSALISSPVQGCRSSRYCTGIPGECRLNVSAGSAPT